MPRWPSRSARAWGRRRSATWPPRWAPPAGWCTTTSTRWTRCSRRRSSGSPRADLADRAAALAGAEEPRDGIRQFFGTYAPADPTGRSSCGWTRGPRRRDGRPCGDASRRLNLAWQATLLPDRSRRASPPARFACADPAAAAWRLAVPGRWAGAPGRRPRDDGRARGRPGVGRSPRRSGSWGSSRGRWVPSSKLNFVRSFGKFFQPKATLGTIANGPGPA